MHLLHVHAQCASLRSSFSWIPDVIITRPRSRASMYRGTRACSRGNSCARTETTWYLRGLTCSNTNTKAQHLFQVRLFRDNSNDERTSLNSNIDSRFTSSCNGNLRYRAQCPRHSQVTQVGREIFLRIHMFARAISSTITVQLRPRVQSHVTMAPPIELKIEGILSASLIGAGWCFGKRDNW